MFVASPPPKTASSLALLSGAHALKLTNTDISHLKLMGCYFSMLGVTLFWLVTLTKYAQKPGCLAWCLAFIFISFGLATRLFTEQVKRTHNLLEYSASRESRSLVETLTVTYALISFAICMAFINTQWYKIDRSVLTQQIIEIELSPGLFLSPAAQTRNPSTTPTPQSAVKSVAQSVAAPTRSVAPVSRSVATVSQPVAPAEQPVARALQPTPTPNLIRQPETRLSKTIPWSSVSSLTSSVRNRVAPAHTSSTGSSFFMEELPPAQLVEVRETENSKPVALHSPTNSPSPAVSMSVLAEYLKELHRVIKSAWTPPRDNTRSAEIIFRIKRSGELALVKVVRSSGNIDSDESAINAITASAPFKPLPDAYSLASLDVDYTFNYTADKLTEIGSGYH